MRAIRLLSGLLIWLVLLPPPAMHAQSSMANSRLEEGEVGRPPPGWRVGQSYSAVIDSVRPYEGSQSVKISRASEAGPGEFGNVMQVLDAAPYRGKRVRLRAAVRAEPASPRGGAGLWLRVDRESNAHGFFDNMSDRRVTVSDWRSYEIVGDVAEDAVRINFGLLMTGSGAAWLDAVSLEVVGDAASPIAEGPRPVSPRGMENLAAFARLLGYVRYFHPSDESAGTDWNALSIAGVRAVEDVHDASELAAALTALFRPIAPTVLIRPVRPSEIARWWSAAPGDSASTIVSWRHVGVGVGNPQSPYRSERVHVPVSQGIIADSVADPQRPFATELGGGVSALVPLALYADGTGTLPRIVEAGVEPDASTPTPAMYTGNDRATRLAAVILAWNIFQHFYPYFDVADADWSGELRRALGAAATDLDEHAFLLTMRRLITELDDGHGYVHHVRSGETHLLPVLWEWIEERLVITAVADPVLGLRPGDSVLRIDGRPVDEVLAEGEALTSSATPQWRRFRAIRSLLTGPEGSVVRIELESPHGERRSTTLRRDVAPGRIAEARPEPVAELETGIWYVDLDRVTTDEFRAALPRLAAATGLIFDLRGYPRRVNAAEVLKHLIGGPATSAQWHVPVVTRPDRVGMGFQRGGEWDLKPAEPHLGAPRVFLTDGRAISYAESVLGIVEHYRLAEIVGGPTAGTNGNVNPFYLPGGYQVTWTGMKVLKHDGSRHHGVGIRPTVPVERTVAGVAAGRDEVLERAISVLPGSY